MELLRYAGQEWSWAGEPIGLAEPESALLGAMLRERGRWRLSQHWFALGLGRPYGPASGEVFLYSLMRKLSWAGAPSDLISVHALLGATITEDATIFGGGLYGDGLGDASLENAVAESPVGVAGDSRVAIAV